MSLKNSNRIQRVMVIALSMMVIFIAGKRARIYAADASLSYGEEDAAQESAPSESDALVSTGMMGTKIAVDFAPFGLSSTQVAVDALITGADRQLEIAEEIRAREEQIDFEAAYPYYIEVNRICNTVTVYGRDEDGAYTIPYKAFVCSAGEGTILGTYTTTRGLAWGTLVGGVYAQYSTRISGPYLFHSVPYFTPDPSDLEYEEYNKLGELASAGCIRLCVEDAKWIYDNCPPGTTVRLYDDANDPGPLGKPIPLRIDPEDERRGWDPTDPDERNPWNGG